MVVSDDILRFLVKYRKGAEGLGLIYRHWRKFSRFDSKEVVRHSRSIEPHARKVSLS